MIGTDGEGESGKSALLVQIDDDYNNDRTGMFI